MQDKQDNTVATEGVAPVEASNFIEDIIADDLRSGKHTKIITRFPPEPNGYLHIGHAKALCINFGVKAKFGGECNLRFDDTNPEKEDVEYMESIKEDIAWLGFEWDRELNASDYFDAMYECAVKLIKAGKAYVCDLSAEEIKATRGTLTEAGVESPYRNRSVEENLDLFERMRAGEFDEGARVLRAKIDMASPNINMRDPVIYRSPAGGRHRGRHPFAVLAGVRKSPSPLRLGDGKQRLPSPSPTDRIRAAQSHAHRDEQAFSQATGRRGRRVGLERPPSAHIVGFARERVSPRGHTRFLRQDRRG